MNIKWQKDADDKFVNRHQENRATYCTDKRVLSFVFSQIFRYKYHVYLDYSDLIK